MGCHDGTFPCSQVHVQKFGSRSWEIGYHESIQLVLPVAFKVGAREILTTKLKVHRAKVGDGVICAGGSDHRLYQGLFPVEQSESNDDEPVPSQAQANKQQNTVSGRS